MRVTPRGRGRPGLLPLVAFLTPAKMAAASSMFPASVTEPVVLENSSGGGTHGDCSLSQLLGAGPGGGLAGGQHILGSRVGSVFFHIRCFCGKFDRRCVEWQWFGNAKGKYSGRDCCAERYGKPELEPGRGGR